MSVLDYIISFILWLIVHVIFLGVVCSIILLIFGDGVEKFLYYLLMPLYFLFFVYGQCLLIKDKDDQMFNVLGSSTSQQIAFVEKQRKEKQPNTSQIRYLLGNIIIGIIVIIFYVLFGVEFLASKI